MRIDPKLIIDFATVADEGSFTRAAQRLRVAQPWLSARVQKLEDLVGFRLFERTTRKVALTARGAEFLDAARRVAAASEEADRLLRQLKRKDIGVLRVGAAPYTKVIRQRRQLIDGFTLAHPDVSVELETGWSLALLARLDAGEIDLSFMMGEVDPDRYESIVLRRYGVALTLSRDHPLAAEPLLLPEIVTGKPVQVFTRSLNPSLWKALYSPLIQAGAQFVEVADMAEGPPDRVAVDGMAAFFDFSPDDVGNTAVVRIPVAAGATVPFQLLRSKKELARAGEEFWERACNSSLESA